MGLGEDEKAQGRMTAEGCDFRLSTVCDPAVGTGRMLMHAGAHCFCLAGQDIDGLVAEICRINGALYVPWLAYPMPAEMLERCKAARPQAASESAASESASEAAAEPPPEELVALTQALRQAFQMVSELHQEPALTVEPEMPVDRRGQGLLFE